MGAWRMITGTFRLCPPSIGLAAPYAELMTEVPVILASARPMGGVLLDLARWPNHVMRPDPVRVILFDPEGYSTYVTSSD